MKNIPFPQLQTFLAARMHSFAAAARELGVSRSAVSQSVRQLEEQLRVARTLQRVLEPYAASVRGFFLCFPSRAQRSAPLRVFVETAQELARGTRKRAATK